MIWTPFIAVGVYILKLFNWFLGFFELPYVSNMTNAIEWFFGLIWIPVGYFPVDTLVECLIVLGLTYFYRFQIRLFFHTVFPMIPFIGRRIDLPRIDGYDDNSQPYYQAIRADPSNKNGMGTHYLYKKKNIR